MVKQSPETSETTIGIGPGHPPVHPGEVLREEFMLPMKLTAGSLAKACRIPRSRIDRIAREDLGMSGDTAVRLGKHLGTSAQFWANLQATYGVQKAIREIGEALNEIEPLGVTAWGDRASAVTRR